MPDPKKPGKPCVRCGRTWRQHKDRAEGACGKWVAVWKHGKRKHVATGLERAFDNEGEK